MSLLTRSQPRSAGPDSSAVEAILRVTRLMRQTSLTVSSLGNASVRCSHGMLITPTRVSAWDLRPEDLALLDLDGRLLSGAEPSTEKRVHVEIYRRFPSVGAILHTHSPWATAWSHLGVALDLSTEELRYHDLARIPCTPTEPAGSAALATAAAAALAEAPVTLLGGHGVIAMGRDTAEAFELCALADQQAHAFHWLLRLEGAASPLRVTT